MIKNERALCVVNSNKEIIQLFLTTVQIKAKMNDSLQMFVRKQKVIFKRL